MQLAPPWVLEGVSWFVVLCLHLRLLVCKRLEMVWCWRGAGQKLFCREITRTFVYLSSISGLLKDVKSFCYFPGLEDGLRVNAIVGLKGTTAGALLLMEDSRSLVNGVTLLFKALNRTWDQGSSTL